MVDSIRSGIAGQIMIGTEALHAPGTPVTVSDAIEFESEDVNRDFETIRVEGISGTLFPRSGRRRDVFRGATGPVTTHLLNIGYARWLWHCFGGYVFSWPGSTNGSATLTLNSAPSNNDTVVIEGQTYTFKTALTASTTANEVLIAATAILSAGNLAAAINRGVNSLGVGSGEAYGSLTPRNVDVSAVDNGDATMTVTDRQARGDAVNSGGASEVATTETLTDGSSVWDNATLTGGVDGTDTARLHTYTFDASRMAELAATLQIVRPPTEVSRKAWTYAGAKVLSWAFSLAANGAIMMVPTWHARSEALNTAIGTASYSALATFFDFTQAALTIDATAEAIQSFSLAMELGLAADRYQLGSAAPRNQLINQRPSLTGSFDREFEDRDLYDAWLASTPAALVLTSTGDTIPSSASTYQMVLTLPEVVYNGDTPNVGGPGRLEGAIPFEVLDDGSSEPITLTYRTDESFAGSDG